MNGRAKRVPSDLNIHRAVNGGFVVRHSYDNQGSGESYMPSQEHAFSSHKEASAHVSKHMGAMAGGDDEGAEKGTGTPKGISPSPLGGVKVAGVAGRAKAAPPTKRTYGAGVD